MSHYLKQLKESWFIIVFLISIVIWYADTSSRLTKVEADTTDLSSKIEVIYSMQSDINVIRANVEWIKEKIK